MRWAYVNLCFMVAVAIMVSSAGAKRQIIAVKIAFTTPVYDGMPIWLIVDTPNPRKIHYPVDWAPSSFGCNEIEIRHNGVPIQPHVHPSPAAGTGGPCGWLSAPGSPESRLPLHIQYPSLKPGKYLVRYIRYELFRGLTLTEQSDWTTLNVLPAPHGVRTQWLANQIRDLPTSPGLLLGDALPSLLASHERQVLRVFVQAMYNQDNNTSMYAGNSLYLFKPAEVSSEILAALRQHGPNHSIAYVASSNGIILEGFASQSAELSLPFLKSSEPSEVAAAAHLLHVLREPHFDLDSTAIGRIDDSLVASTDLVIAQKNEEAAHWLANHFGFWRVPKGRQALWRLAESGLALEQAMICITWFHDPGDLPRIAAEVEKYDSGDPLGRRHAGVVGNLRYGYGEAARSCLRDALLKSRQVWVRTTAGKELTLMNDAAGFGFFIETLEQRPFYRDEMRRWLDEVFPDLRTADDTAVLEFLRKKAARVPMGNEFTNQGGLTEN